MACAGATTIQIRMTVYTILMNNYPGCQLVSPINWYITQNSPCLQSEKSRPGNANARLLLLKLKHLESYAIRVYEDGSKSASPASVLPSTWWTLRMMGWNVITTILYIHPSHMETWLGKTVHLMQNTILHCGAGSTFVGRSMEPGEIEQTTLLMIFEDFASYVNQLVSSKNCSI
jgi:hypothetical protein